MEESGGKIDKNFRIWVELASKKRKCQRCDAGIQKGSMFVRMGNREKARTQACMCAPCFELVMSDLSEEFHGIKSVAKPPMDEETVEKQETHAPLDGPHCFVCGLVPEKCKCSWEAYR